MPNLRNIEAPVTLVAFGRSGTSLLSSLFDRHPDFRFAGETANLVFGSWHAAEFSASGIPPLVEGGKHVPDVDRAARAVRQAFLTCIPDDRPHWFHKPIGLPVIIPVLFRSDQWSEAAEWYWKVMRASFPKARYFTVLRNPCDVVLSSQAYWGYDQATMWHSLGLFSYILGHSSSPVDYAIRFEDLTQNRKKATEELFSYLGVRFDDKVMDAFGKVHAPVAGRDKLTEAGASRQREWDRLDARAAPSHLVEPIIKLFSKFGFEVDLPTQFTSPVETPDTPTPEVAPSQEVTIAKLRQTVSALNHEIERLHVQHQEMLQTQLREQRAESNRIFSAQREWIDHLEVANRDLHRELRSSGLGRVVGMFSRLKRGLRERPSR
jgi:hypothetical protein